MASRHCGLHGEEPQAAELAQLPLGGITDTVKAQCGFSGSRRGYNHYPVGKTSNHSLPNPLITHTLPLSVVLEMTVGLPQ